MLIQKLRGALHAIFAGLLLLASGQNSFSQDQSQPAVKTAPKKSQAGAESCDGALDIVPVKSMTFTRKRRPSKTEQPKPANSKADSKSEKQQQL